MGNFMKHACGVMKKYATKVAFLDDKRTMTHRELDRESGQIYAWLKEQGIGKEDFVQIVLPRGTACISAIFGVLKAGAAFQINEDTYPPQRIEFIHKDVGARLVLDEKTYRRILRENEPRQGYEETSPHDAAFACYTSGSTGTPKGILHEYGTLDLMMHTVPLAESYGEEPHILVVSMSFILALIDVVDSFNFLRPTYIVSSELLRDVSALSRLIDEKRAYSITISPSYWRLYRKPGASLKTMMVAGESARGVYYEGGRPVLHNLYTLSEAGFAVLAMELDKPYDHAPLGKPIIEEIDVHLEDEDGRRVEGSGEGEVCFANKYMRGYIHLPDKTDEVLRGGIFHTGDLARREEDGAYFLIGRKDDMLKINGNRVEPGEIEGVVQKLTGLKTVVAKGFDIDGRAFICLYYLRSEATKRNLMQGDMLSIDMSALADMLPYYMLPTYYIPLTEMPINERGKTVRRLLMPPNLDELAREYVPPANEDEEAICQMMAEILGKENIGAQSDFYLLGGDSLRTIRLIALAGERGYSFTARDLYEARTPRKLAKICGNRPILGEKELREQEALARQGMRELLPMQKLWAAIDLAHPKLNLEPIVILYRMKRQTDPERLKAALDRTLRHYPIFSTRFARDEKGNLKQIYDESLFVPTKIQDVTEAEIERLQQAPLEKINLFAGGCYRAKILRTERTCYLFLQAHHAFVDGSGLVLLRDSLFGYYEDALFAPAPDYYYYLLRQMELARGSESYREAERYYEELYRQKLNINPYSTKMHPDREEENKGVVFYRKPNVFPRDPRKTNIFYMTAAALATAKSNGTNRALVYCTHNGRDDRLKLNSAGGFAFSVPAYLVREDGDTPEILLKKVREQAEFGFAHAPYSYFPEDVDSMNETVLFLYQKDIFSFGKMGKYIESELPHFPAGEQPWHFFAVSVVDDAEEDMLRLCVIYSPNHFTESRVEKFVENYLEAVDYLSNGQ